MKILSVRPTSLKKYFQCLFCVSGHSELGIIKKGHKFKLVRFWKVKSFFFKRSQVWSQTCDLSKAHKFWPKHLTFWNLTSLNLWTFVKVTSLGPNLLTFLIIPKYFLKHLLKGLDHFPTFTVFLRLPLLPFWCMNHLLRPLILFSDTTN